MHDRTLVAVALAASGLGLAVLLVAYSTLSPEEIGIGDAQAAADGAGMRVRGTIAAVAQRGTVTIVTIEQPATIDVVVFDPVNVTPGTCVLIDGKKGTYERKAQVTAERITRC
jgi:uncharacterized phage protein gp47/JayE